MNQFSQTQLANILTLAGIATVVLSKFGVTADQETVTFVLGAIFSIGSVAYNWYQRFAKGDLTLLGMRK